MAAARCANGIAAAALLPDVNNAARLFNAIGRFRIERERLPIRRHRLLLVPTVLIKGSEQEDPVGILWVQRDQTLPGGDGVRVFVEPRLDQAMPSR